MRRTFLALLLATLPGAAGAQQDTAARRQSLPRDVRREVVERWSAPAAARARDRLEIDESRDVPGDVAVLNGPLIIAGHVRGNVLAVNSDVLIRRTARIDGDLLIVGGEIEGRNAAQINGSTRIYRQSLAFREEGDRIVAIDNESEEDENWLRRLEHHHEGNWSEALRIVQAGPYNRVEGLPIQLGPVINRRTAWGSLRLDAAAILRTGSSFNSESGDIGYDLRTEVRFGHGRGIGIGAEAYNVVDPVQGWDLSDLEVALAAFLTRRDYRDYYNRHGGRGLITLYGARDLSLTASYGLERWTSRDLRNPFTLFNGDRTWRPNPLMDEGLFHVAGVTLKFDTRTDPDDPWSGWFVNADVEHGRGAITSLAPTAVPRIFPVGGISDYTRGFFDFRRYNRLGPDAQLNVRAVVGGWLGGDQLPLERRVSVDGPGSLPGFDFHSARAGIDVGSCDAGVGIPGRPAQCDRIALAQIEYRGDLRLNFTGDWEDWPRHYHSAHGDVVWVLFADAGRGWNTGTPDGALTYGRGTLPSLSTFRSDLGLGLDLGGIGVYAAKSVSTPAEPVNFFVRLRHRF
ncbi:MAG TPA: hypothetical protein VF785_08480 [Gemmatimonadaceae bacterium]